MAGFAAVVDWFRPVAPKTATAMMEQIPHRSTAGSRLHPTRHAALAEGRTHAEAADPGWDIAAAGPLTIVGDIRLFDRGRLRAAGGGDRATSGLDDRELVLAGWQRRGPDVIDVIDGEFAFVVWDQSSLEVHVVRDRFAVRPVFHAVTDTGIIVASEAKQVAAVHDRPIAPNLHLLAEFIELDFVIDDESFIDGIAKLPAASILTATTDGGVSIRRYWRPSPLSDLRAANDLPLRFRDHLVEAVGRRVAGHRATVSQLSGGIDSSTVAASAGIVAAHEPIDHATVSAVFDVASIDESEWISQIVESLPFPHDEFTPAIGPVEDFDADMRAVDGPLINPIRDLIGGVANSATERRASVVLTGEGGDYVLDQHHHLADLARARSLGRFAADARRSAAWKDESVLTTLATPARQLAPPWLRTTVRRLRPSGPRSERSIIAPSLESAHGTAGAPSVSNTGQAALARAVHHPNVSVLNEVQANLFSRRGLEVSHPYFDQHLVSFVASIEPTSLPFDGRSKTLARQGFVDILPRTVLDRPLKTVFNEYLVRAFRHHHETYRDRFAVLPGQAGAVIDPDAYERQLRRFDAGALSSLDLLQLVRVWHALAWMDVLGTYKASIE